MAKPVHIVAVTAVIIRNKKVLLVKRGEHEIANPGEWAIPGGKVEIGDTISNTLIREVKEETNLTVTGKPHYLWDGEFMRPDSIHAVVVGFLCKVKPGKVTISHDFTDFAWADTNTIDGYNITPNLKKALKRFLAEL